MTSSIFYHYLDLLFSCLRKFKDVAEEKDYLEVNISNLTAELEELKNQNRSMLDKQHSWSTTSSMDCERAVSPTSPMVVSNSQNSFDENSNSMSYNKAANSVKYNNKQQQIAIEKPLGNATMNKPPPKQIYSSSPIIPEEYDNKTLYIQTPSGFTPIRRAEKLEEADDVITPLNKIPNNKSFMNLSTPKRTLNYGNSGQVKV